MASPPAVPPARSAATGEGSGGVGFELAPPEPVGVLEVHDESLGAGYRFIERGCARPGGGFASSLRHALSDRGDSARADACHNDPPGAGRAVLPFT